jgi:hypothetical protein
MPTATCEWTANKKRSGSRTILATIVGSITVFGHADTQHGHHEYDFENQSSVHGSHVGVVLIDKGTNNPYVEGCFLRLLFDPK